MIRISTMTALLAGLIFGISISESSAQAWWPRERLDDQLRAQISDKSTAKSVDACLAQPSDVGEIANAREWPLPQWETWVSDHPLLKLRASGALWRGVSESSDRAEPRLRLRSQYLEVPTQRALSARWSELGRYSRDDDQLMIIGDSLSATDHYVRCFRERKPQGPRVTRHQERIVSAWLAYGDRGVLFKDSYAAQPSATSWALTQPSPFSPKRGYGKSRASLAEAPRELQTPLLRELYENRARFAVVLIGTNDLHYRRGLERFSAHYLSIVETLLDHGVLPLLFTIPPQLNKRKQLMTEVAQINQVIKVIAQAERLPLVHLHDALKTLKSRGLRADGIHLNAYQGGCQLNQRGLRYGQNIRNQLTLSALATLHELLGVRSNSSERGSRALMRAPLTRMSARDEMLSRSWNRMRQAREIDQTWRHVRRGAQPTTREHRVSVVSSAQRLMGQHQTLERCPYRRRARRAHQWKLVLAEPKDLIGPPRYEYGTWRVERHAIDVKRPSHLELLVAGSLGRKVDLRREQFWLSLADGTCVKLHASSQRVKLPVGAHHILHYARLESPPLRDSQGALSRRSPDVDSSKTDSKPGKDLLKESGHFISRVVFSWEAQQLR